MCVINNTKGLTHLQKLAFHNSYVKEVKKANILQLGHKGKKLF